MARQRKLSPFGIFVWGLVAFIIVYELFLWAAWDFSPDYFQADRCVDGGGCWDKIDRICRKHEPDARDLCQRIPRN